MKKPEFLRQMIRLRSEYPDFALDGPRETEWFDAFKDLALSIFEDGISKLIRTYKFANPKISDLCDCLGKHQPQGKNGTEYYNPSPAEIAAYEAWMMRIGMQRESWIQAGNRVYRWVRSEYAND